MLCLALQLPFLHLLDFDCSEHAVPIQESPALSFVILCKVKYGELKILHILGNLFEQCRSSFTYHLRMAIFASTTLSDNLFLRLFFGSLGNSSWSSITSFPISKDVDGLILFSESDELHTNTLLNGLQLI